MDRQANCEEQEVYLTEGKEGRRRRNNNMLDILPQQCGGTPWSPDPWLRVPCRVFLHFTTATAPQRGNFEKSPQMQLTNSVMVIFFISAQALHQQQEENDSHVPMTQVPKAAFAISARSKTEGTSFSL